MIASTQTVETPVEDYLERAYFIVHSRAERKASRKSMRLSVRKFDRFIAWHLSQQGAPPRKARISDFEDFLLRAAMHWERDVNKNSAPSANKLYRNLAAIWRAAWRDGLVASPTKVLPFNEYKKQAVAWFPDQFQRILDAAALQPGMIGPHSAGDFWTALLCVVALTGARISAVMSLEWSNVDFLGGYVKLQAEQQKQRADQTFELNDECKIALRVIQTPKRKLVFDWPYDPKARTGDAGWKTLNRRYRKIIVDAGLQETVDDVQDQDLFHAIRRCVGTWIAAAEGLEAARDYLGHSHVSVTERYLDWRQIERKFSAVKALPKFQVGRLRLHTSG